MPPSWLYAIIFISYLYVKTKEDLIRISKSQVKQFLIVIVTRWIMNVYVPEWMHPSELEIDEKDQIALLTISKEKETSMFAYVGLAI